LLVNFILLVSFKHTLSAQSASVCPSLW